MDDHEIMRDGLREVLERSEDFKVVGQAADGEAAVRQALSLRPDVIVMDVMMPLKNGIDACREVTERLADTKVLILTAASERTQHWRQSPRARQGTFRSSLENKPCFALSETLPMGSTPYPQTC